MAMKLLTVLSYLKKTVPEVKNPLLPIKIPMGTVCELLCTVLITNIEKNYKQIYYF